MESVQMLSLEEYMEEHFKCLLMQVTLDGDTLAVFSMN